MTTTVLKKASREWWTDEKTKTVGEWVAPIIAWLGCIAMLLAVVAILLGPAE